MKKLIVLVLMVLIAGISCKSPSGPTDPTPKVEYHALLQVWYTEDPADLSLPPFSAWVNLHYEIYDPNPQYPLIKENGEYTSASYRNGSTQLTKIGEYQYVGYIPNVRIQNSSYDGKHIVRVKDVNLKGHDWTTAKGVVVDKSKDLEIAGWDLRFNVFK